MRFILIFVSLLIFSTPVNLSLCDTHDVHAIILARGGSKGIKNKNLVKVGEISILARAIQTIQKSKCFQYIWVSTDIPLIEKEAKQFGALVHRRDEKYSRDETTSLESVKEFLSTHQTINNLALFQCTSVFLKEEYIEAALNKFQTYDCVFAAMRSHKLRWKSINGYVMPLNFNPKFRPRRQDWDGELIETGMFYFSRRSLINAGHFQNERCTIVEIRPEDALEIDTPFDLELAQFLMQKRSSGNVSIAE